MNDPYSWLEDITSDKTVSWYSQQNKVTDENLKNADTKSFIDDLIHMSDADSRGLPVKYGSYTFWIERRGEWLKPKLMMTTKKDHTPRAILDFDDGSLSLDFWYPSVSGKKVLYGTSENGNEQTTIRVFDVLLGTVTNDVIPFAGFTDQGSIVWLDDRRFIYPRMNGFNKTGPEDKWLLGTKLYLHVLGDDPKTDVSVFGTGQPDTVMMTPTLSCDKKKLFVAVCHDELTHKLFAVSLLDFSSAEITLSEPAAVEVITGFDTIYVRTNYKAARYRLLSCPENALKIDLGEWDEILPESDDVLTDAWLHQSKKILAHYSHNVSSELRAFDEYGNQTSRVNTPPGTVVHDVRCIPTSPHIYLMLSGFTTPPTIYTAAALDVKLEQYWAKESLTGDTDIQTEQLWVKSRDGTQIPYFVVCRRGQKTPAPTIAYGYGGFNISLEPSYLGAMRSWVLKGGVYVLMNLRGGGEFGEAWHAAGAMQNKQNTFDDCHAIAEDLVARGITTPDMLGVLGGSNGGLLVTAVTVQRPELYRAGAALVPLTDMLEFYKHQVAEFWVHEYGDPRIPEQKEWIKKWSPYHNINPLLRGPSSKPVRPELQDDTMAKDVKEFPALYVECAIHDARVHPFHAFKFTHKLQDAYGLDTKGPLLLRTWTNTGHQGGNLSPQERAEQTAEYFAFFARELGLN